MVPSRFPKNRWAWVEVSLAAIRANTKTLKALLPPRTKLMCAVKADAYGHGAVECAKAMYGVGADQFAVATLDEGIHLRQNGIKAPILILNEVPLEGLQVLLENNLMPTVYSIDFALALGEKAVALGKVARYHLAIDTGMTRIGVFPSEAVEFRDTIEFHRGLECAGTYTHFATADVIGDWDFRQQSLRFADTITALREAGFNPGLVHCDNTPGMILHPECHYDMVRAGIGLYGLHPADTTAPRIHLEPAMSVRARITRVACPAVGEGVGYGLTYRIPRPNMQIATVPVGYADGLARMLSNNMDVLVGGRRYHQVGLICMDQFMIANDTGGLRGYTQQTSLEYGDVVTIVGVDGQEEITMDEMAARRNTINYEVACDFSLRLDRVFT